MTARIVRSLLLILIGFGLGLAVAISISGHTQDWIVVSGIVHHLDGAHHCNNTLTPGLGLEHRNLALGVYQNSNCRTSWYLAHAWMPLRYGALRAGLIGGVVSGYTQRLTPVAALTASLEGKKYGMNVVLIPPSGESGKGVIWLQFKRRF